MKQFVSSLLAIIAALALVLFLSDAAESVSFFSLLLTKSVLLLLLVACAKLFFFLNPSK